MFYIHKKQDVEREFLSIVAGIYKYDDLKDEKRSIVVALLLNEQGNLCAICERKKERFTPTIEHFLPKSTFPHLQLDYYNLYVTCQSCNEPKGNFLVPPYIFDERFAPQTTSTKEYPKPIYGLEDGKCSTFVSQAKDTRLKKISATHYHAYLLQNTLDLLHQNRYDPTIDANRIGGSSLLVLRAVVWYYVYSELIKLNKSEVTRKYNQLKKEIEAGNYPEFVSLVVYVYELALHKQLSHTYPSSK